MRKLIENYEIHKLINLDKKENRKTSKLYIAGARLVQRRINRILKTCRIHKIPVIMNSVKLDNESPILYHNKRVHGYGEKITIVDKDSRLEEEFKNIYDIVTIDDFVNTIQDHLIDCGIANVKIKEEIPDGENKPAKYLDFIYITKKVVF